MVPASAPAPSPVRGPRKRADEAHHPEVDQTEALNERSARLARFYQGKIETVPKVPVRSLNDFSLWYTPGIAQVSREIAAEPDRSFELTGRWNTIAIVTDGSRVLGLGDIGPVAALPVMEGKALLFKFLGGVDAIPVPVSTRTPEELVETVVRLAPAFGAVNLEDIASPKCFYVLEELQKRLPIPVWHDDQLGTAAAIVAGLLNALNLTGRSIASARTVLLGAGAANLATARLLLTLGHDPRRLTLVDHRGILHGERSDIDEMMLRNRWKYRLALQTHGGGRTGGLLQALPGADVLIAASTPVPGTVGPEAIRSMASGPVVFALANPLPEIWPADALAAGAAVVATGRSDFPNQVNNSLVFPAVFRGVLDARARSIPDELVLTAARELARGAEDSGVTAQHILPTMDERAVFPRIAAAVAVKAVELGIARTKKSREEFLQRAEELMERPAKLAGALASAHLISPMPDEPGDPEARE
ncbi:MAG: NADP-dependent malic enzyme [Thermoplasmata archaeon]|nr:NADP-dependent malic enzyme [Thermoplasmata archaeon]MCI4359593.1 NADP-dependent malic enzyme [Thermoplasmata archaeon]